MEWLGDFDVDIADPDSGFLLEGTAAPLVSGRLFVVVGNRTAYRELLALWRAWVRSADEKLPRGFGALADVFKHLNDVREWGPRDRVLATGVVAYWEQGLSSNDPAIRFEAELWCRSDSEARNAAYARLRAVVSDANGQCISDAAIPEIDYHGVVIELSANVVRETVEAIARGADTKLLRVSDVKYFSPKGQASLLVAAEAAPLGVPELPLPTGEPIAALLDGLPLANHAALQGRLTLDDPDGVAASYRVGEHRHGTSMASLITRGELDSGEPALVSKVYVRPVMIPGQPDFNGQRWETFPPDELPVDLVHRAVRRIFEGDDNRPAEAPSVKIINLSIGDSWQLFDRYISPWARLLDWLAWRYQVLFVVSAGNHLADLSVPAPPGAIVGMADADLRAHVLRSIVHQRVQRRLLAPAESVNALTVGSLHSQAGLSAGAGRLLDLFRGASLPSPLNPVASGVRRAIKPEILVPGGRQFYAQKLVTASSTAAEFEILKAVGQPGQVVAAPGGRAVPPNHTWRTCGTSNAAALATRRATQFHGELLQLREGPGGAALSDLRAAVILKAMLAHGASWGEWEAFIENVFDAPDTGTERWRRLKRACAQILGYGPADFDGGSLCTDQRVILLGSGDLGVDEAHVYQLPIPPALHAQAIGRRLSLTLAWFTPINPRHRNYRIADLWFDPPTEKLRLKRRDVDHDTVTRGTLQHEILEGTDAVAIEEGETIEVQVNCRTDASSSLPSAVPYALMVTLEVAPGLPVSIYNQVKVALDRLRAPVRVRPTAARPA